MTRTPSQQPGVVTVRCADGRCFQARKGNPALAKGRGPIEPTEWEVLNELAKLHVAAQLLDSASLLARVFRLPSYRQAKVLSDHAARRFKDVARRTPQHERITQQLAAHIGSQVLAEFRRQ